MSGMFVRGRFAPVVVVLVSLLFIPAFTSAQTAKTSHNSQRVRADAKALDIAIDQHELSKLVAELPNANLTPAEREYFQGILEDRANHPKEAIKLLSSVLPGLRQQNPHRAALALRALADDDFMLGKYNDSVAAYDELLKTFANQLSPRDKQDCEDNRSTFALLKDAPPQELTGERDFTVPMKSDPLGTVDVPVTVGNSEEWWIFDTGANQSTVTTSTAKRLGLKISAGQASTSGSSGAEVALRTAVIPELRFGKAIVRNVVALVIDDKSLNIDLGQGRAYQIQGILGYPVLAALGAFRIDGKQMHVTPEAANDPRSVPLYTEELMPLQQVNIGGQDLLMIFDTGATTFRLSAKYVQRFPQQFAQAQKIKIGSSGAGGMKIVPGFQLKTLALKLGAADVELHNVDALGEPLTGGQFDELYGNSGQQLLQTFDWYTIDFKNMRLTVGKQVRD